MNSKSIKYTALVVVLLTSISLLAQDTKSIKNQNTMILDVKKVKVLSSEEDKEVVAQAINNMEFDFDKATIHQGSYKSLDGLADWLKARDFTLKVSGHADYIGSDEYNLQLSDKRAQAVKDYLVEKGADPALIEHVGFGRTQPIASNETDSGRQKNRRVEFTLY